VLLDEHGHARLGDLGLARRFERDESRATESSALVGTVEYLSPEQALGRDLDGRSDLYSLGVVLFEMVTGHLPYENRSTLGTVLAHITQPAPDVRTSAPDTPSWLAGVIAHLLEKDPQMRYAGARPVLADLERRQPPPRAGRRAGATFSAHRVGALLLALAALGALGLGWLRFGQERRFVRVLDDGKGACFGVDSESQVLWTKSALCGAAAFGPNFVPVRVQKDRTLLAAIQARREDDVVGLHQLTLLEPESGDTVRTVELPNAAHSFPGFAFRYGASIAAFDLDGNGIDEVLVTFAHRRLWPSYTVIYEPAIDRSRVLMASSVGQSEPRGTADVDGDGQPEILFAGAANRLGWYHHVSAVRSGVGARPTDRGWTPDSDLGGLHRGLGVWFALVPADTNTALPPRLSTLGERRVLAWPRGNGGDLHLDLDGFVVDASAATAPSPRRAEERELAYRRLREARVLERDGRVREAAGAVQAAERAAATAGDVLLATWARRRHAALAVAAGEPARGEREFERLMTATGPGEDSRVALDAAQSFHLAGDLQRALAWYRRALRTPNPELARTWETLEGLVFALGETGRWDEAARAIEAREPSQQLSPAMVKFLAGYLDWRRGRPPATPANTPEVDIQTYWRLEFQLAAGADAAAVLREVEVEKPLASESVALLMSVESECLARLGRREEALAKARDAFERVAASRRSSLYARVHLPIVESRLRKLEAGG
jgi:tetratricopeptide (TPR) repeat protein